MTYGQMKPLTISHLIDNFYVYTTYKPVNGSPFPSNSMFIVTEDGIVLIDTPWDTTQTKPLLDTLKRRYDKPIRMCLVTHFHDDRTAGLEILNQHGIKTYSSWQTDSISQQKSEKRATFHWAGDTTFTIGKLTFETFYPGEGHTKDNLVVWFPKEKILYGGCLVKSTDAQGLGNTADANLNAWPISIQRLIKKYRAIKYVIPGHRRWGSKRLLTHTMKLLRED